jgi:hypothetical protein
VFSMHRSEGMTRGMQSASPLTPKQLNLVNYPHAKTLDIYITLWYNKNLAATKSTQAPNNC